MNEPANHSSETNPPLPGRSDHPYTARDGGRGELPMTGTGATPVPNARERSREPLGRADRVVVTMLAALLGSTIVGFVTIGGQLLGLQRQVGDLRTETREEITRLSGRVDNLSERVDNLAERVDHLTERVDHLTERVDNLTERVDHLTERVDNLSERVDSLSGRMTRVETVLQTHHGPLSGP